MSENAEFSNSTGESGSEPSTSERVYLFGLLRNPDPAMSRTFTAIAVNFIMSHMLIYGINGNLRTALLAGTFTIPVSGLIAIKEASSDYERWKMLRTLKLRDITDQRLPFKSRHDWSDFHRYIELHKMTIDPNPHSIA